MITLIRPDWSLQGVEAFSTTRAGGVSGGPWASLNLGASCGDDPAAVAENRRRLQAVLPASPHWLKQVHGTRVIHLDDWHPDIEADAAWTDRPHQVLAIQTADCLPVLLADREGGLVAAAHAGWRGLAGGVLSALVAGLPLPARRLEAWLGPAIGQAAFEVGPEVRAEFVAADAAFAHAFRPGRADRWQADLKSIAAAQLRAAGVLAVQDCGLCTHADPERFFSYRRDAVCGRMGSFAWLSTNGIGRGSAGFSVTMSSRT